jgi:arsenite/tail-anchored protein-transporting ATPase
MTPRTILYTGKGGVGKTSVAAATALAIARSGLRTIVLSTDPAHSLSDSLEAELGPLPVKVAPNLWGQEVQAEAEMERNWHAVQRWLGSVLSDRGVDRILAEELTVPPGMDEIFSLLQLKRYHESEEFDVVVVDCAPTGETLRLLSFPEVARWWLEKVFPWERRLLSAARPLARTVLDLPLPGNDVLSEVQRLVRNLIEMSEILRNRERASIRLVMNPERMVIKEAQRTFTYLNLYGYLTDAVVVNRVFPDAVEGGYFAAWRDVQREQVEFVEQAFAPVPVLKAPFFEQEVIGPSMLERLGDEVFAGRDPHALLYRDLSQELVMRDDTAELLLKIPFVEKAEIELKKIALELVVRVGGHKRNIILPSALASYRPREARFENGSLAVKFEKAPSAEPAQHGVSGGIGADPGGPAEGQAAYGRTARARAQDAV